MKRLSLMIATAALGVMAFATSAFAAAGDPPTFAPSTQLGPSMNDYASSLVTGLVALYPVVLVIGAVFTLFVLAKKAIGRWIGRGKATNAI